ncbi:hypothetical protein [Mycoplasmopsis glycophila]|uniref:Uncharacterized protein n=1 Tax=Mycoplasmopsis glycophila TaxID=171285 RepID=A0A449AWF2_9BACT|nr:hypothetical protein [Mycoplasmopsis glycophila]VEU71053.1 Uncharacterised protein [Mycoplasmopsis glycophila]
MQINQENKTEFEDIKISANDLIIKIDELYDNLYKKKISKATRTFLCKLFLLYFYYPTHTNKDNQKGIVRYVFDQGKDLKSLFFDYDDTIKKYYSRLISLLNDNKIDYDKNVSEIDLDDQVIINLMQKNLSPKGYLKTKYDQKDFMDYLVSTNLLIVDNNFEASWFETYEKSELTNEIFESLKECYKLDLFLRIPKNLIISKIDLKKDFIALPSKDVYAIYRELLQISKSKTSNKEKIKEIKEKIRQKTRRKEMDLVTIQIYSSNFFDEIKETFKVENSQFKKTWKKVRMITSWNNRFLVIFAICFVLSTLFFEVFQGLSIWNETLSKEKLIYIGFALLCILVISGIILLILYILNRQYIRSYNFSSNVEYKSLGQKSPHYFAMIDIFDATWELISEKNKEQKQDSLDELHKNKNIFSVWKIVFDFSDMDLNPDMLHEIYLFKSYYEIISTNKEHTLFKNQNALEFNFIISESQKDSLFVKRLEKLIEQDDNFECVFLEEKHNKLLNDN